MQAAIFIGYSNCGLIRANRAKGYASSRRSLFRLSPISRTLWACQVAGALLSRFRDKGMLPDLTGGWPTFPRGA